MSDHPTLGQYCWFIVVVCLFLYGLDRCFGPASDADDRAMGSGTEARVVEKWPWE
jgi:hypothetical protein